MRDDIRLLDILPGFASPELDQLRQIYGNRRLENSPCWTINKMFAHATGKRADKYDYSSLLNTLAPKIVSVVRQINEHRAR